MNRFFLILLLSGCSINNSDIKSKSSDECADACFRLRELKCPEGDTLEDGTSCKTFCEITQGNGHDMNPSCISRINICSDLDKVPEKSKKCPFLLYYNLY
jgi:hypothetical protein